MRYSLIGKHGKVGRAREIITYWEPGLVVVERERTLYVWHIRYLARP